MSAMGDRKLDRKGKEPRYKAGTVREVTWTTITAETIRDVISTVTATGCAIRFGYSRDRGAFCIGIIGDGDPYTIWAGNDDECYVKLEALIQAFDDGEGAK